MAVLGSTFSSTSQVLHRFVQPSSSSSSFTNSVLLSLWLRPPSSSYISSSKFCSENHYSKWSSYPNMCFPINGDTRPRLFSSSTISLKPKVVLNHGPTFDEDVADEELDSDSGEEMDNVILEFEDESTSTEERGETLGETVENASESLKLKSKTPSPVLTLKEKKELASYAHRLGDKLKCQMVGKSGVTGNVATSFVETLEANELLKIKIHRTCPGEVDEVVQLLQEATGPVVVSQIGRTVIIYRPSLTKMKAEEEKKKVVPKSVPRKDWQSKPPGKSPNKVRGRKLSMAGRQTRTKSKV